MKDKKIKISKTNYDLFNGIFGEEMRAPNVEQKEDNIFKMQRDQVPLGYRISETLFNYVLVFFTYIVPFGIILNYTVSFFNNEGNKISLFFKELFPKLLIVLAISLILLFGIKILQATFNSILLIFYAKSNEKHLKKMENTKKIIREALDKKDKEDKAREEEEIRKQAEELNKLLEKQNEERRILADISKDISNFYLETQNDKIRAKYQYDDSFSTKFKNDVSITLFNLFDIRKTMGTIDIHSQTQMKELENRCRGKVYNLSAALGCILECKHSESNMKLSKLLFYPNNIMEN